MGRAVVGFLSIAALVLCADAVFAHDDPSKPTGLVVASSAGARIAEPSMERLLNGESVLKNAPRTCATIGTTESTAVDPLDRHLVLGGLEDNLIRVFNIFESSRAPRRLHAAPSHDEPSWVEVHAAQNPRGDE